MTLALLAVDEHSLTVSTTAADGEEGAICAPARRGTPWEASGDLAVPSAVVSARSLRASVLDALAAPIEVLERVGAAVVDVVKVHRRCVDVAVELGGHLFQVRLHLPEPVARRARVRRQRRPSVQPHRRTASSPARPGWRDQIARAAVFLNLKAPSVSGQES